MPHPNPTDLAGWILLKRWGLWEWAGGLTPSDFLPWNKGPFKQAGITWQLGLLTGGRSSKGPGLKPTPTVKL